jgi:hypothetical protein
MRLLGMILLTCLGLSACATRDVAVSGDNLRIGPVPIVRVEF